MKTSYFITIGHCITMFILIFLTLLAATGRTIYENNNAELFLLGMMCIDAIYFYFFKNKITKIADAFMKLID